MGTRGNVLIKESKDGVILVNLYHHMDSYPSGLGKDLFDFLEDRVIVNGINMAEKRKISNGITDLAAQIACLLKDNAESPGGVYIERPRSPLKDPNDYTYIIYPETKTQEIISRDTGEPFKYEQETGPINIIVYEWKKKIFEGSIAQFGEWIKTQD